MAKVINKAATETWIYKTKMLNFVKFSGTFYKHDNSIQRTDHKHP